MNYKGFKIQKASGEKVFVLQADGSKKMYGSLSCAHYAIDEGAEGNAKALKLAKEYEEKKESTEKAYHHSLLLSKQNRNDDTISQEAKDCYADELMNHRKVLGAKIQLYIQFIQDLNELQ